MAVEPEASTYAVERFSPNEGGPIMAYEHLHRYVACAEIARGKRVLDVACGEGYGAALIARTAKRVVGVDIDPDVVRLAEKTYGNPNLEFLHGDMFELPFESRSFDVVTCFEAIEHVSDPGRALDEIARVVAAGGTAIISTPDKAVYSDAAQYENEFHLHEFYRDEFSDELGRRFATVRLFGQRVRAGSELVALDVEPAPVPSVISYLPDPADASKAEVSPPPYLIAVCTDGEGGGGATTFAPGVLLDGSDRLVDEYIATVQGAAAFAAEKDGTIAKLASLVAERDALLAEREADAIQRRAVLIERETELVARNSEIVEARAYAVEIGRQYELSVAEADALRDVLLRVTRESEERAVHLLALEEHFARLNSGDQGL